MDKKVLKKMDKASSLLGKMVAVRDEVLSYCMEYLSSLVSDMGGCIRLVDDDGSYFGNQYVSVCYDGGGHPEYASNVFSSVRSVFSEGGKLWLDIEDDGKYPISNLSFDEVVDVAFYVRDVLIPSLSE